LVHVNSLRGTADYQRKVPAIPRRDVATVASKKGRSLKALPVPLAGSFPFAPPPILEKSARSLMSRKTAEGQILQKFIVALIPTEGRDDPRDI
jgi:hypothetical protein